MGHITYHNLYAVQSGQHIKLEQYYPEIIRMKNAGSILNKSDSIDSIVASIFQITTQLKVKLKLQ